MNSAAVKDPELIRKAVEKFESEKITVAIDARRNPRFLRDLNSLWLEEQNRWKRRYRLGPPMPGIWSRGDSATSMDGDGALTGYDLEFTGPSPMS